MSTQKSLVAALTTLTSNICAYTVPGKEPSKRCDCKFGLDEDTAGSHSESGNGCPEVRTATAILNGMTDAEFERVSRRVAKSGTWTSDWNALTHERSLRKEAQKSAAEARAAAMKLGAKWRDLSLRPGPSVVAKCSQGHLGLITAEKPSRCKYPDGTEDWAWVGIHLVKDPGSPWSSRSPEVVCSLDQLSGYLEHRDGC